eukprot:11181365-Karenia_brevis.AAC.1
MLEARPAGPVSLDAWWAKVYPVRRLAQWTALLGKIGVDDDVASSILGSSDLIVAILASLNADFTSLDWSIRAAGNIRRTLAQQCCPS